MLIDIEPLAIKAEAALLRIVLFQITSLDTFAEVESSANQFGGTGADSFGETLCLLANATFSVDNRFVVVEIGDVGTVCIDMAAEQIDVIVML